MTAVIPGGLLPRDLMLIVGAPGAGKSTLAHQIADHAARRPWRPDVYHRDESKSNSLAAPVSPGVDSRKRCAGILDQEQWRRVFKASEEFGTPPIQIDCDTFDAGMFELRIRQAPAS